MVMALEFKEYKARKVVNVRKHVDGAWFWDKYSAHPYIGCASGCSFCYSRGGYYLGRRPPETFDRLIQIKINAVERLEKELNRLEPDLITCGDWQQPAENRYRLSRGMLQVVLEKGFPLLVLERSPLVTRDLDLLTEIHAKAWVGVIMSFSNVDPVLKRAFEPKSHGLKRRLKAMEKLAQAGFTVGTALMPILPIVGDDDRRLEDAVLAFKEHGGSFVLGAGLTMDGAQAQVTVDAYRNFDPSTEEKLRGLYRWKEGGKPQYGPQSEYANRLALKIRELCEKHGLKDRMPRHVPPGPLAANKRIAERLFIKTYDLELEQAEKYRVWAYRKAAWAVDEWPESIADLYAERGEAGLLTLPSVGKNLAAVIGRWLKDTG